MEEGSSEPKIFDPNCNKLFFPISDLKKSANLIGIGEKEDFILSIFSSQAFLALCKQ